MTTNLLVVEDDPSLREILVDILREEFYTVYEAEKGAEALKLVEKIEPHLVILDLGLPDIDGESVCSQIKKHYPVIQVIILTGRSEPQTVVNTFEKGADDYVTKPFDNTVLLARIKTRLKKQKRQDPILACGDIILNRDTLDVTRDSKRIELSKTEFELLEYLMINAGKVVSREQILSNVWAQNPDIETRVVDVYIGYLRKKIDTGQTQKRIQSKRGFGYLLNL